MTNLFSYLSRTKKFGKFFFAIIFSLSIVPLAAIENSNEKAAASPAIELPGELAGSPSDIAPPEVRQMQKKLAEGEIAFTERDIEEFLPTIVPLVEEIAGRKFKKLPLVRLSDRKSMVKILFKDIFPQFEKILSKMDAVDLKQQALRHSKILSIYLLGKYGFSDKILYILPRNFLPLMSLAQIDKVHVKNVAKLIVAHELTHALQDQEINVTERIESISNSEESMSFNSVIEGHAMWVMKNVGSKLKIEESVVEASKLFSVGVIKFKDSALDILQNILSTRLSAIYQGGEKFIEYFAKQGEPEKIWELISHPPKRTNVIFQPEKYSPESKPKDFGLAKILEGWEKYLGKPPFQVQNMELGYINLQAAYANMAPEKSREILEGIECAQTLVVTTPTPTMGNVTIFVLKDPSKLKKFVNYLEEMGRDNIRKIQEGNSTFPVEEMSFEDYPLGKVDVGRRFNFAFSSKGILLEKNRLYRFGKGPFLIEIFDGGVNISDANLTEMVMSIFQRLIKLNKPNP